MSKAPASPCSSYILCTLSEADLEKATPGSLTSVPPLNCIFSYLGPLPLKLLYFFINSSMFSAFKLLKSILPFVFFENTSCSNLPISLNKEPFSTFIFESFTACIASDKDVKYSSTNSGFISPSPAFAPVQ